MSEQLAALYAALVVGIEAAVEAGDAAGVAGALFDFAAAEPKVGGWTADRVVPEQKVRAMFAGTPQTLRDAVVREVQARAHAVTLDAEGVVWVAKALDLVLDHWHPGREQLLLDVQLTLLRPEPLRVQVREALLADVATMQAGGLWRAPRGAASACAALVGRLDEAQRRTLARWVMVLDGTLQREASTVKRCRDESLGASLARRRLGWSAEEVLTLLRSARLGSAAGGPTEERREPRRQTIYGNELRFALPAAEQLADADLQHLAAELRVIVADVAAGRFGVQDSALAKSAPRRFRALLDRAAPAADALVLPEQALRSDDGFAVQARAEVADVLTDPLAVPLLLHCLTLSSVRAGVAWQRRCRELGGGYPQAVEALRRLLRLVPATQVVRAEPPEYVYVFMRSETSAFVRGVVWAYATLAGEDAAELLGDVAVHCGLKDTRFITSMVDAVVANAAVAALGSLDGAGALDQLRRVQGMAKHKTFQKSVATAFDAAALRSGLTREQVIERGVPDHGVDARGRLEVPLGEEGWVAAIVVGEEGKAGLEYVRDGKVVRSLPVAVREACADQIRVLKAQLKEVQATLRSERERIEAVLATERTWTVEEWVTYYLTHPLTGVTARRLIWEASSSPDGPRVSGLPQAVAADDGASGAVRGCGLRWQLRGADGAVRDVPADAVIRLWHPVRAGGGDITAWRTSLTDAEFRQPFKQAFRERYLLTPAEEETVSYSNRFAAHILRYGQVKALTVARGWSGLSLGGWHDGASGEAVHEFPGTGWRARFFLETVSVNDTNVADLCSTDQVRFERKVGRAWQSADLREVPVGVLSEGLRDVDLFVAVASIGADPNWTDRGQSRQPGFVGYVGYWREYSFGVLPEAALARREALGRILPRTRIADRVEVGERFVRVRGDLGTYKIHLGSGNVLMEPDDTYLCIVSARSKDAGRVFLPFEEDGVLSLIVSKAFLLAADSKITDTSILRQLPGR
ncbi:MAG: DUF4132 domain-containing protein [Catenulispora sp.]|nr:DUF4132 domain-containing protein [Catenulispora sp.]